MATLTERPDDLAREPERERAMERVQRALDEQHQRVDMYDGAVGTSLELQAYVGLREARRTVSARQRWLEWLEDDRYVPAPPGEDASREALDEVAGH
jgi:hypothetical protein